MLGEKWSPKSCVLVISEPIYLTHCEEKFPSVTQTHSDTEFDVYPLAPAAALIRANDYDSISGVELDSHNYQNLEILLYVCFLTQQLHLPGGLEDYSSITMCGIILGMFYVFHYPSSFPISDNTTYCHR